MRCPQCGAEAPEDSWNCPTCRINLYWASQHYAELTHIRSAQGLVSPPNTPPFLVNVSTREFATRTDRGLMGMNKVRDIARRVMRGESVEQP
jgi:hypothetical protein